MSNKFIAHRREKDGMIQPVALYLTETAALSESFAASIGVPMCERLLGLCHDLGKFSWFGGVAESATAVDLQDGVMGSSHHRRCDDCDATLRPESPDGGVD